MVLESVPARVAEAITTRVRIPTIGIGAGAGTDGQVLVLHDLVGLTAAPPRFAARRAEVGAEIERAAAAFRREVESRAFPGPEHAFSMPEEEWAAFSAALSPLARAPERR